jgi:hypothetical protein
MFFLIYFNYFHVRDQDGIFFLKKLFVFSLYYFTYICLSGDKTHTEQSAAEKQTDTNPHELQSPAIT